MRCNLGPAFRQRAIQTDKHNNPEQYGKGVEPVRATPRPQKRNRPHLTSRNADRNPDIFIGDFLLDSGTSLAHTSPNRKQGRSLREIPRLRIGLANSRTTDQSGGCPTWEFRAIGCERGNAGRGDRMQSLPQRCIDVVG